MSADDFEISCTRADVTMRTQYGLTKMYCDISGADISEIIEAVGVDEILDAIGEDEVIKHFGIEVKEED